ncbi:hypothetical protein Bca4012_078262 [Brassica carinata]
MRLHHTTPSQASTFLHRVDRTVFPPLSSQSKLLCKSVGTLNLLTTTSPLRLHHNASSQASTVLHRIGLTTPIPSLVAGTIVQKCGLASTDRYYITAASPLYYAVSSITVLHKVGTATLSPDLQSSTEVLGLLAIKTHWLISSTSILTSLRSFERGL